VPGGRDPERRDDGHRVAERQMRQLALVAALVLAAGLLLVFVVENNRTVRVSFVVVSAQLSLVWVILLSALAGAVAGAAACRLARRGCGARRG
jgi:uncharacterized integral membrane protein